jgi:N-acetylglucosaminyl-diphospho-decaprenol L-rhamnosyltransferase
VVLRQLAERATPPDYVFFLNPDAVLENETVAILADFLDARPKAACAGAEIHKPGTEGPRDGSLPLSGHGERLLPRPSISARSRACLRRLPGGRHPRRLTPARVGLGWAGAAVLARFDVPARGGIFSTPTLFPLLRRSRSDAPDRQGGLGMLVCFPMPRWSTRRVRPPACAAASSSGGGDRPYLFDSWRHYFSKNHGRGLCTGHGAAVAAGGHGGAGDRAGARAALLDAAELCRGHFSGV